MDETDIEFFEESDDVYEPIKIPYTVLWNFFNKVDDGYVCNIAGCNQILKGPKNTSTAGRHLNSKKHRSKLPKLLDQNHWNEER